MTQVTGLEHLTLLGVAPPGFVSVAARAGFGAVGLRISPATDSERPWPMSPGSPMLAETARRCADLGVFVLGVEAIRLGAHGDGASQDGYEPVLAAAAELGASFVNVICEQPDLSRMADGFAELAARAKPYRIRPVVEFMAYRSVCTLAAATAIAASAPDGGILVDALHVQRCGVSLAELGAVDPRLVGYAQLCDAPLATPADEVREARAGRLLPGDGELPLRDLLDALPAGLPVTVEAPLAAADARAGAGAGAAGAGARARARDGADADAGAGDGAGAGARAGDGDGADAIAVRARRALDAVLAKERS
jgi:sugar phosphate isomerase/epimerase